MGAWKFVSCITLGFFLHVDTIHFLGRVWIDTRGADSEQLESDQGSRASPLTFAAFHTPHPWVLTTQ